MLTANLTLLQPDLKRLKETCIAFDVPEEHDQPERPYISFKMTEVHPTTATAEERITIGNVVIMLTVSIASLDIRGTRQGHNLFWSSGKVGFLLHERGNGR